MMREGHLRLILDILDGLCESALTIVHDHNGIDTCVYCGAHDRYHTPYCPVELNRMLQQEREELLAEARREQ